MSLDYLRSKDSDLLPKIHVIGSFLSRIIVIYYAKMREAEVSAADINPDDLSLIYIHKLVNLDVRIKPINLLRDVCRDALKPITNKVNAAEERQSGDLDFMEIFIETVQFDVDSTIGIADTLTNLFQQLDSERLILNLIYLLINPSGVPAYIRYSKYTNKHLLLILLSDLKQEIGSVDRQTELTRFDSRSVDKILMITELYKQYPELASLLLICKDFKKFIQFVVLFSGNKIEVPTAKWVEDLVNQMRRMTTRIQDSQDEDKALSLRDREKLAIIATMADDIKDIRETTEISPVLSEYLRSVFIEMARSYDKLSTELIRKTNFSSSESISRSYEIMMSEYSRHIQIFSEISASVRTTSDLAKLASSITEKAHSE